MKEATVRQEVLKMTFEEVYDQFQKNRLTTEETSELLGVCSRTFLRLRTCYEEEGFEGLYDRRLAKVLSHRTADAEIKMVKLNLHLEKF